MEVHDAAHNVVTSAAAGTTVHPFVQVSGSGPTPTGLAFVRWYANNSCTLPGAAATADYSLSAAGAVDIDGNTFTPPVPGAYSLNTYYTGDARYARTSGPCVPFTVTPMDTDADGAADIGDNCPLAANADQADRDGDGLGDVCDGDRDGDGAANATDNCPDAANAIQADIDGDGIGDACDPVDDRPTVQDHNGSLQLTGLWVIAGTVTGNIRITDGTLIVNGRVEGNVQQSGSGSVVVGAGGVVTGNVREQGDGDVLVAGTVEGNLEETGAGSVLVSGLVDGNVSERDSGNLEISGTVNGNATERGVGDVIITEGGFVDGNVSERDAGSALNNGTVTGRVSSS
ncbi:MAG: hypothetical protein CVU47_09430 [Chloroflexi bacterium HGW-Chloroflexi-9]|nr:MAG: hypothetical protein CVU47_09430 [Chloroflexi bacterium HGW-Chloroflexi-9]